MYDAKKKPEATLSDVQLLACGRTDAGRGRASNEDALLVADAARGQSVPVSTPRLFDVSDRAVLLAVADGMGGKDAGEVASALALSSLRHALAQEIRRAAPPEALRIAIAQAHAVLGAAAKEPARDWMGSTLIAAVVDGDQAFVACVGDCRAYVARGTSLVQVTRDQSFVQMLVDRAAPANGTASGHPYLQALGREPTLRIPIVRVDLARGDILLLCSDGLTSELHDSAIRDVLAESDPDTACAALIDAANAGGGEDNITVIVARVQGEGACEVSPGVHVAVTPVPSPSGSS